MTWRRMSSRRSLHLDVVVVLGGDDDGLDPLRGVAFVFDRDLGFAVRPEVGQDRSLAGPRSAGGPACGPA